MLWVTLPVTFGHPTAGCSTTLAFSTAIVFTMKNSALFYCFIPFIVLLRCDHPLVDLDTESAEVVQKASRPQFLPFPNTALPNSPPNRTYFGSLCVLYMLHKPHEQDPPLTYLPLDTFNPCLHERIDIFTIRCSRSRDCGSLSAARRSGSSVDSM